MKVLENVKSIFAGRKSAANSNYLDLIQRADNPRAEDAAELIEVMAALGLSDSDIRRDAAALKESEERERTLVTLGDQEAMRARAERRTTELAAAAQEAKRREEAAYAEVRAAAKARAAAATALTIHLEETKARESEIAAQWEAYNALRAAHPRVFTNE